MSHALPSELADAVHQVLQRDYAGDGDLRALPGEYDDNVHVRTGDRELLLKVVHRDCDPAIVEMQLQVLAHLAATAPELPLPRVVPTSGGQTSTTIVIRGERRIVWASSWLPGRALAAATPIDDALLQQIGAVFGRLDRALQSFAHPAMRREFKWNLRRADWIGHEITAIAEPRRRALVENVLRRWLGDWRARFDALRTGPIHGDGNDHNLLVAPSRDGSLRLTGLVDFGDLNHSALVGDCAIAAAYAAMTSDDPAAAIASVAAGYDRELRLGDDELAMLAPLVLVRLATSVVNSAAQHRLRPDDDYAIVSSAGAFRLLELLVPIDERLLVARIRAACGRDPWPAGTAVMAHLDVERAAMAPVLGTDLPVASAAVLDLSFGSLLAGDDPERFDPAICGDRIADELRRRGAVLGLGRYAEARPFYLGPAFGGDAANAPRRTIHLGIDVFAPAGTPVHAPLAGTVHSVQVCRDRLDYGGLVLLRHRTPSGTQFATIYGHLDPTSIATLRPGRDVARGEPFARLGAPPDNGDWPPHLHLQVLADDPARGPEVPDGVALPAAFAAHSAICPDPSPLLGLADARAVASRDDDLDAPLARRRAHFASNLRLSYRAPIAFVRGSRHFLYDDRGQRHLDAYNNVPHVGHAAPVVAAAIAQQTRLLATNTRYLHELPLRYAERLVALLPAPLRVCFFVNSGSEANELAVRLCRAHTGRRDMAVMAHGYHGNTVTAMELSPYKWRDRKPEHVHATVQPDVYRGAHRRADAGARYAADFAAEIGTLAANGRAIAGYLHECMPSVGGQIVLPDGFLRHAYAAVRAQGGLCVADDVQTALGRTGHWFFGFEQQAVVPDVLVLGKPLGNGFPLAAVVTTEAVAATFAKEPEFFSTFGGNTVACAAGIAVLDELDRRDLVANARSVGEHLLAELRRLQQEHEVVGDVRGSGLFLGVELVRDRDSRAPHAAAARHVKERLRERRVLIGTDGPFDNVLKIRPPMTFDRAAADTLLAELAAILREPAAQPE